MMETFEELVDRVMREWTGRGMETNAVIKIIMMEIAKKLDEDRNASLRGYAQMEDRQAAQRRP
jgi:hypothetical protein